MLELFSYGVEPWPGLNGTEVPKCSEMDPVLSIL